MIKSLLIAILRTIEFPLSLVSGAWRAIAYKSDSFGGQWLSPITWAVSLFGYSTFVEMCSPEVPWRMILPDMPENGLRHQPPQVANTIALGIALQIILGIRIVVNWFILGRSRLAVIGRPWAGPWEMPIAATLAGLSYKYCCPGVAYFIAGTYACSFSQSLAAWLRRTISAIRRPETSFVATTPEAVTDSIAVASRPDSVKLSPQISGSYDGRRESSHSKAPGFASRVWASMVGGAIMSIITGMIGFNFRQIGKFLMLMMGTALASAGWQVEPPEDIKEDARVVIGRGKEKFDDLKEGAEARIDDLKNAASAKARQAGNDLKRAGAKAARDVEKKAGDAADKAADAAARKARQSFWRGFGLW